MNTSPKVKILGAGPTGCLLAMSLANYDINIDISDYKTPQELMSRDRAYAISNSSRLFLQEINLWNQLLPYLYPFDRLIIQDQEARSSILFNSNDLPYSDIYSSLGWILDHNDLMRILIRNLDKSNYIKAYFGSSNGYSTVDYDLVISAEGPQSSTRKELKCRQFSFKYKQACTTAKILMRGSPANTAYEIFRHEGPMAILPMGNNIFQVVWSAPLDKCRYRNSLSESIFLDNLAAVMPEGLEPDIMIGKQNYFPLSFSLPLDLSMGKHILVGESAHTCHPVGGQGLNLSWRDVKELRTLLIKSKSNLISIKSVPKIYSRKRYFDILTIGLFTDFLIRLFSNRNLTYIVFRRFIFYLLLKLAPLRKLSLKITSYSLFADLNKKESFT